jgi:hypothetical protein
MMKENITWLSPQKDIPLERGILSGNNPDEWEMVAKICQQRKHTYFRGRKYTVGFLL